MQGALIGQAQTSFGHPLFIAEQFSLDGLQAASAYPLGTFSADEGATLRGELQRPYPLGWAQGRTTVSPYIFGAASQGWIDDPTLVQPGHMSAKSFGVGLQVGADAAATVFPLGATFTIELARGVLERRRRGTSVSRQCRLRREFLRFALSMFKRG